MDLGSEKGASPSLKVHFGMLIQLDTTTPAIPLVCGSVFSTEHALSCPSGGSSSLRQLCQSSGGAITDWGLQQWKSNQTAAHNGGDTRKNIQHWGWTSGHTCAGFWGGQGAMCIFWFRGFWPTCTEQLQVLPHLHIQTLWEFEERIWTACPWCGTWLLHTFCVFRNWGNGTGRQHCIQETSVTSCQQVSTDV